MNATFLPAVDVVAVCVNRKNDNFRWTTLEQERRKNSEKIQLLSMFFFCHSENQRGKNIQVLQWLLTFSHRETAVKAFQTFSMRFLFVAAHTLSLLTCIRAFSFALAKRICISSALMATRFIAFAYLFSSSFVFILAPEKYSFLLSIKWSAILPSFYPWWHVQFSNMFAEVSVCISRQPFQVSVKL